MRKDTKKELDKIDLFAVEEKQEWIFTFGRNSKYWNNFVAIYGTHDAAKQVMIALYGLKWQCQHMCREHAGVEKYGLKELRSNKNADRD